MIMQIYNLITTYIKDNIKNGCCKGEVYSAFTGSLPEVYKFMDADPNEFTERVVYEYPSLKRITKADVSFT
jgi:hypothetical protein